MTQRQTFPPALAQFAGDRVELLPTLPLATSLRKSLVDWWLTNQLWISWSLLLLPLVFELIFNTFHLPYLIFAPLSLFATYLIYRNARQRLQSKTREVEALSQLHLATAEALATAI